MASASYKIKMQELAGFLRDNVITQAKWILNVECMLDIDPLHFWEAWEQLHGAAVSETTAPCKGTRR